MDDVKHLDVRVNRLHRWHVDGLLCIGDAAHAMSPVGGVGINLAVQDAVAAATRLAEPLRRGAVSPARPGGGPPPAGAADRSPSRPCSGCCTAAWSHPSSRDERMGPPGPVLALLRHVPQVTFVPAYLIGVGTSTRARTRLRQATAWS